MPKINEGPLEQAQGLSDIVEEHMKTVLLVTCPTLICGVSRKVNTGNFENIDVMSAMSLPIVCDPGDIEDLKQKVSEAAEKAFELMSGETGQRYSYIKELQKGGRPPKQ